MARLPRAVLVGGLHLILIRSRGGESVFPNFGARGRYLDALRDAATQAGVAIHAYGLLDDEVRLLVTPSTPQGLAQMVQSTGRRYVAVFNRLEGRKGSPWDGRFRSTIVDPAAYFLACLRFVESEASQLGETSVGLLCSSRFHHLGEARSPLIAEHPAFFGLGNTPFEREAAYRRVGTTVQPEEEVAAILRAALSGWALGSAQFAGEVQRVTARRSTPLQSGRPGKRPG